MNRGVDERDETRDEREERDETRRMAMTSIERARRRARRSCETVDGSDRSRAIGVWVLVTGQDSRWVPTCEGVGGGESATGWWRVARMREGVID